MSGRIGGLTVVGVCRGMGIEPTPELMWSVGNIVRGIYERRYGALPEKDLRAKTYAGGSHCFAVYPETMRPDIEKVILSQQYELLRQGDLFKQPEPELRV